MWALADIGSPLGSMLEPMPAKIGCQLRSPADLSVRAWQLSVIVAKRFCAERYEKSDCLDVVLSDCLHQRSKAMFATLIDASTCAYQHLDGFAVAPDCRHMQRKIVKQTGSIGIDYIDTSKVGDIFDSL